MAVFVEILSFILEQYFGWDEFEIAELWRTNPGSQRSIIRQIGSSLPSLFPRLYSNRSIIRDIGSALPLPPIKRPHFQICPNDIYSELDYTRGSADWIMGPEYYDDDTFSCVGSEKDNSERFLSLDEESDELFDICDNLPKEIKVATDTSDVNKKADMIMDNTAAMKKISALEEELNRLRAQIASLVVAPPCTPSLLPKGPLTSTPCTPGPPLPPPPPPPPPPAVLTPVKSVIDVIKENRSRRKTIAGLPLDRPSNIPDMSDILKGIGSVKLKSIERSPGGTPVRKKPLESEGTDPSSIIARALKKKFAQRKKLKDADHDSPSLNKENMSSFSPSPSKSPKIPQFGPHLLKPTKGQRLSGSNFNERPFHSRPLAEINV